MKRKKPVVPKVVVLSAQPPPTKGTTSLSAPNRPTPRQTASALTRGNAGKTGFVRPSAPPPKPASPRSPLQQLIEQTVQTLLLTATPEGDLTFRADVRADVMSDLSLDVGLFGRKVVVTFYTEDDNTRRLLAGQERELRAVLEAKGLKVHKIRVQRNVDPDEPPPVPVYRRG